MTGNSGLCNRNVSFHWAHGIYNFQSGIFVEWKAPNVNGKFQFLF